MDMLFRTDEFIIDDSHVYVVYPEEEIYSEVVGLGNSLEEALNDCVRCFNQMMYSENGVPILIGG